MNRNLFVCDCGTVVADAGKPKRCPACGSSSGAGSSAGTPFERIDDPDEFFA